MGNRGSGATPKESRFVAKRAVRARHKRRMKARAIKVYSLSDPKFAARLADNLKVCSLPWCCGNPRTLFGRSMQERRQDCADRHEDR